MHLINTPLLWEGLQRMPPFLIGSDALGGMGNYGAVKGELGVPSYLRDLNFIDMFILRIYLLAVKFRYKY